MRLTALCTTYHAADQPYTSIIIVHIIYICRVVCVSHPKEARPGLVRAQSGRPGVPSLAVCLFADEGS